ncbi:MAG: cupin domain-containing protein [Synergistaceae bacterium]|nr:cupin domain-containing protein [Synergistaceae bacterium]
MLFKSDDLVETVMEKPRGGNGSMQCKFVFKADSAPAGSSFQMVSNMTLQPGCSMGYHKHPDNEELYVFLSGEGTFTDDGGATVRVGPGDTTLTLKGQSHGIENTGSVPLKFLAAIVKG